jgi:hypothetical protein
VQSYTNRSIDWPGQPRISWDDPLGSPWNKQAISMLVHEFTDTVHRCLYPELQTLPSFASVDWLYAAIETRLEKTRSRLRKLLRPLTQHETSEEQNNRLQDEASRAATQSRRRERRNKVNILLFRVSMIRKPLSVLRCSASTAESLPLELRLAKMKLATGPKSPKSSNISPRTTCHQMRRRLRRVFKRPNESEG